MTREAILLPDRRTTYGAIELTTGCGRRCQFCGPDLNPQLDLPKDKILAAVRATVRDGGRRVSLATEDTFIWGQVRTETPFYFPNREALLDLFSEIAHTPGIEEVVLTHCTIAPFVVDPTLIAKLSAILLDKSPYRMPRSSRPDKRVLIPLIGLETGSTRLAKRIMPSKGVPFPIDDWPSVVLEGLAVANANDWYPMLTLMVGSPDETDDDVRATLDLVYEIERRGLFAFLIPSIFTPLPSTRMAAQRGVTESRHLTPLQWQLVLKCWKMNMDRSAYLTMAPVIWRLGALVAWALRLRRITGPNSTWPMLMLSGMVPESVLGRFGKIHLGGLRDTKSRAELIAGLRPGQRRYLREDAGDRQTTAAVAAAPAAVV